MTAEQRFERIESALAAAAESQREVVAAQRIQAEGLVQLTQAVSQFVAASDARMKRTEDNLDALIRAITAERKNGKGH